MGYFDLYKQGIGQLMGGIGGLYQGITGTSTPQSEAWRQYGGQLTGGQRTFNQVPSNVPQAPLLSPMSSGQTLGTQDMSSEWMGTPTSTQTSGETTNTQTSTSGGTGDLDALYSEIDNIYNETMSYLGGQEESLRTNQPGVDAGVEGQYAASRMSAETEKGEGERDLATAGTAAGQRKEDALGAGRRLFNELQMGGQQRFGGASSAGEAYSELTRSEER